jgi:hypothetical protein
VVHAQQSQPTATVPKIVRFSGSFRPANGQPAQPVESVTLSVYSDQAGGTPLWQETQNVAVDGEGKYSVLMGATLNDGVPMDLLSAGEPRWMGAQFNRPGEAEQARVLMASVPYALKSVDAETLGGKPASAYLLASSGTSVTSNAVSSSTEMAAHGAAPPSTTVATTTTAVKPRTISGTQNYIPVFTDATNDLGNSVMQQANGSIGIGTVPGAGAPTLPSLDLRTTPFSQIGMGQTVDYLTFFASDQYGPAIYWDPGKDLRFGKGGTGLYNAFGFTEQMRIQSATGNVGIGTQAPGSKLDVAGNINLSGSVLYQGNPVLQVANGAYGDNLSLGLSALTSYTTGQGNTAVGAFALQKNAAGMDNTANGDSALISNTNGYFNTANGYGALAGNTTGINNTASGWQALFGNSTGSNNIAIGVQAANFVSPGNSNNIHIGSPGSANDNATIRIGVSSSQSPFYQSSFFAAGIYGVNPSGGVPVVINSNGQLGAPASTSNTALGLQALESNTAGTYNTATGVTALAGNTDGTANTASGYSALLNNTTGSSNTAVGYQALLANSTGSDNTAVGFGAGTYATGGNNTLIGFWAGLYTNGSNNTASGYQALMSNTGTNNTAVGSQALQGGAIEASANSGGDNTAIGSGALINNSSGGGNTALGFEALNSNTTGINNTAIGGLALYYNTTGCCNIAIGPNAANLVSGGNSNNIHIGSQGASGDSGVIRIGTQGSQTSFFVTGVNGVTTGSNDAIPVLIDASGQLGTVSSSRRYKEDIQDMGDASRDLMRLRPVTFRYKKPFADGSKPIQYGLIAEEVDEVYPDLVAHSADGQIETVKYQVLDSMLLNEVQKQNQRAQQQDETIRRQQEQVSQQQEQIRKLEARLTALEGLLSGKVSAAATAGR